MSLSESQPVVGKQTGKYLFYYRIILEQSSMFVLCEERIVHRNYLPSLPSNDILVYTNGMKINIKTTNLTLTPDISAYLEKRLSAFEKLTSHEFESAIVDVEIGRTSAHHQTGD